MDAPRYPVAPPKDQPADSLLPTFVLDTEREVVMDNMVGALAIFTIGAVLVIGLLFFLRHNMDPKNRAATKEVFRDGPSAAGGGKTPEHGSR